MENDMTAAKTMVAEWVLPGHPDKLCDALADRIVGEVMRADPCGQCGIEAACAFDHVFVTGLIGFDRGTLPDIEQRLADWVRETYRSAGYGGRWDPLPEALRIDTQALRIEQRGSEWQELRHLSDDQCICVGYAQDTPQTDYLPGALWTARRIAQALHARQQAAAQGAIGPDGKVIVRGEERDDGSFRPISVSVSLHHAEDADWLELRRHAQNALRDALGGPDMGPLPELTVNAAGMFLCGGPTGDNGTTGKKLVMDAYGPGVPIGGGAWSGKDFHKPDRVGGLLARRLALQCVQAGVGRRVRVQLEYRPNSALPESVHVWSDGRLVPLPPAVQPVPTRDAVRSMIAELAGAGFLPLASGQLARWGHLGAAGSWWEPRSRPARAAVAVDCRTASLHSFQ
jgi:S-adenosylmethionine synthetase